MTHEDDVIPSLRFTPYAWAKFVWFRDYGITEIGGFGITNAANPLLVEDFIPIKQKTTSVSVKFDDEAVADFFDQQVDLGRKPEQFARIWLHTHPGNSPDPSSQDEDTFKRCFGRCDWAVMAILAAGGRTYARLRLNACRTCLHKTLNVEIDWFHPFGKTDHQAWKELFDATINEESFLVTKNGKHFETSVGSKQHLLTAGKSKHNADDFDWLGVDNNGAFEDDEFEAYGDPTDEWARRVFEMAKLDDLVKGSANISDFNVDEVADLEEILIERHGEDVVDDLIGNI